MVARVSTFELLLYTVFITDAVVTDELSVSYLGQYKLRISLRCRWKKFTEERRLCADSLCGQTHISQLIDPERLSVRDLSVPRSA